MVSLGGIGSEKIGLKSSAQVTSTDLRNFQDFFHNQGSFQRRALVPKEIPALSASSRLFYCFKTFCILQENYIILHLFTEFLLNSTLYFQRIFSLCLVLASSSATRCKKFATKLSFVCAPLKFVIHINFRLKIFCQ